MLHRIQNIISITAYTVVCKWTNGEIRAIDLEEKLKEWAAEPNSVYKRLLDKSIFFRASIDPNTKTLFWDNLIQLRDTSGNVYDAPLDLDPEVLYQMSIPINVEDNMAA